MIEMVRGENALPARTKEDHVMALLDAAAEKLEEARSLSDVKQIHDQSFLLEGWVKRQIDLSLDVTNKASLFRLETEHRLGEFLQEPGAVQGKGRPEKMSLSGTFSPLTLKQLGIPSTLAQRYRLVASVPLTVIRELAVEVTSRGVELTRAAVLKIADRWQKREDEKPKDESPKLVVVEGDGGSMPPAFRDAVVIGDARLLARQIPANSISLCLCDPVYKNIEDYAWLAKECERVLVPGGNLVVQSANLTRYECEVAMRESGLAFVDLLAEVYPYALQALWKSRIQVGWKPHLWFSKGPWVGAEEKTWIVNRIHAGGKRKADVSKELHPWGDSEEFALGVMRKLCCEGSVVWDPFTGSGVVPLAARRLGLSFVAFEIDPEKAELARKRVQGESPRDLFRGVSLFDEEGG